MNRIKLEPHKITLSIENPSDWALGENLTGSRKEIGPGIFEYSMGALNLQRIFSAFTGTKKPVVTEGQWLLDKEREKLIAYNRYTAETERICALDRAPMEPNGKFVPFAHQSLIASVMDKNPNAAILADCFLPDTTVLAEGEYRKISDVTVGMKIETLRGPSHVEKIMQRHYKGNVIRIKTNSALRATTVTADHEVFVVERSRCVIPSRGNTFCTPTCYKKRSCPAKGEEPFQNYRIVRKAAKHLTLDDCLLFRQRKDVSNIEKVDYNYLTLLGFWVAEGNFKKYAVGLKTERNDLHGKSKRHGIMFSFHKNEEETYVSEVLSAAKSLGLTARVETRPDNPNLMMVSMAGRELADRMFEDVGEYSYGKHLPSWFFGMDKGRQMHFLKCIFNGDAHIKTNVPEKGCERDSQKIVYVTVSYQLAAGIRDSLLNLGIRCSGIVEGAKIDKNGVVHRECFRLIIPRRFMPDFGYPISVQRRDMRQVIHEENGETYTLLPIRKLSKYSYDSDVHNLTSAGHDSYLTEIGLVKNCGTGKTGSGARAVELAIEKGDVVRGKILISAPLSILETSWVDDIKKFTNLKVGVLWFEGGNKDILGTEEVEIHNFGEKPLNTVAVKTKTTTFHKNDLSGSIVAKLTTLEKASPGKWIKFKAKVKVAYDLGGTEAMFGPVMGRTAQKEETKKLKMRAMLADPQYDVFVINHDGVKHFEDILAEHQFAWVIIDESTKIKNSRSAVFSSHVEISKKSKRRNILTGTPNPNGFTDLWAQYYFLDRGLTLGSSFRDFLSEYFTPIKVGHFGGKDAFKWVFRSEADKQRLIARVRRTSILLKQRDCVDLPPRTDLTRVVRMTGEQERAYLEMEEQLVTEFTDTKTNQNIRAEAVNILSKMMKLRQITSGYLPGEGEGIIGKFATNPKLDDLDALIEDFGENKFVVACQFKEEIRTVLERYEKLGMKAIYGDVAVKDRNESVRDFQTTDNIQGIVLQPAAAAHGLTLTKSGYLIFLSLSHNFEYYFQTAKRIERIGQTNPICVIHILAALSDGSPTIDHDLVDVLGIKARDHASLFDAKIDLGEAVHVLTERMIERSKNR